MWKRTLVTTALPLALLGLALGANPAPDTKWKAGDQKKLGEKIAKYYDAKDKKSGINDAWEDLDKVVEKIGKKFKKEDILSFTEDWEAALYQATLTTYKKKPKKGRVVEVEITDPADNPVPLAMHFPAKYSVKGPAYPLLLLVPDVGQSPKALIDDQWIEPDGLNSAILVAVGMPEDTASWDKLEVDNPSGIGSVMSAFGYAKLNYAVDMDRVFIAGAGKGITAALATAAATPHCFAGVVGRGAAPEWTQVTNFGIVPTLFVSGGTHATAFADAIKEAGGSNCTLASGGTEADIWAWLGEQKREAYPLEFSFSPYSPYMKMCSWLLVEGFDVSQDPKVTVRVDRAANTITIDAQDIATLRLYLNDEIADLGEMVKVVVNGEPHEQRFTRQRRTIVDLCYNWGDWGRVFCASAPYDVQ